MGDADYAFPHSAADESRRLELSEQRLDPLTVRRIERLEIGRGARCLEIGGGRGSIVRWLAGRVGPEGHVTATDLQVDFLGSIDLSNVEVLRHDVRRDTFPEASFDLVHTRAVLMHIPDLDAVWASQPEAWNRAFPNGSLARGRSLLRQIHQLGLADVIAAIMPGRSRPALTPDEAEALYERPTRPDFLGCGFVHIGVWGRRPDT